MNALATLRGVNSQLNVSQDRISTGLQVASGKENAAYFQISETMKGDSAAYASVSEGLTLAKNSISTARFGTEAILVLSKEFMEKLAFAQGAVGGLDQIGDDLGHLVKEMQSMLAQSTFNGDDMVGAGGAQGVSAVIDITTGTFTSRTASSTKPDGAAVDAAPRKVVTGISRAGGTYKATTLDVTTVDVKKLVEDLNAISSSFTAGTAATATMRDYLDGALAASETVMSDVITASTKLGQAEKSIENQQEFLTRLVANIDTGVGSMIDADMEEEASRLQALQAQQQLSIQALSIANAGPQNVLSLFR